MTKEKKSRLPKGVVLDPRSDYNYMPRPFREISANEFWDQFDTYGCGSFQSFHQVYDFPGMEVYDENDKPIPGRYIRDVHVFWYSDHGIAIEVGRKDVQLFDDDRNYKGSEYQFSPRFFRIGCEHKWVASKSSRMCYHISDCELCGAHREVDTSG